MYTYLYTKYIKLYTTHTYELPEFSSKIRFPGNSIFKSSIWVITLTDLSSNLLRHEPFKSQNNSTTLFNQSFFHLDHKNLQYLHILLLKNIGVPGGIPVPLRSTFLRLGLAFNTRYTSFRFESFIITF